MHEKVETNATALSRFRQLQEELSQLSALAKEEALAQATQAIATLNALGLPYRLLDDSASRAPTKRRKSRSLDCRVCGFTTDPPHNARKHSAQGDDKQAFTDIELEELGLRKAGV